MAREDQIEMDGVVTAMPGGGFYTVEVTNKVGGKMMVTATLSGKMTQHKIRVIPGDAVKVAVSPYDLSKGRIMTRVRGTQQ